MKRLLISLLLFSQVALAAGTIDSYPEGEKLHQARLAQVHQDNLLVGVKGPLATQVLRYRDIWKGQKRTFVWSAQKFENPDGTTAYAVVFTQLLPNGRQKLLMAGGSAGLEVAYSDEEEPAYLVVYEGINRYIRQAKLEERW